MSNRNRVIPRTATASALAAAFIFALWSASLGAVPAPTGSRPAAAPAAKPDLPAGLKRLIEPLARRLERLGLPSGVLTDKAREGLAKKIDAPRIVKAVRRLAGYLQEGFEVLKRGWRWPGRRIPASLVTAYAEARFSGVKAASAARVLGSAGLPKRWRLARTGLDVLADLSVTGLNPDLAVQLVARVASSRSVAQVRLLPATLSALSRRYGLDRTSAARTLARELDIHRGNLKAAAVSLHKFHKGRAHGGKSVK